MRRTLPALLLLAACHRGSPIVKADLAAPEAPPDLLAPAAATPLLTLDGKKVDLSAYRKKVTLLAFWGTFCEPCLKELPLLGALHDKTKYDTDLSIVAISTDAVASDADRLHVAEVARDLKLTFPVLIDAQQVLATRFSQKDGAKPDGAPHSLSLPTTVLLLANGHYARQSGFDPRADPVSFVSDGMANIARAEAGTLPDDQYDDAPIDPSKAGTFKMVVPAISKAAFASEWPKLEAQLKGAVPNDKLAALKAELLAGKPGTIEVPMSALKKKD